MYKRNKLAWRSLSVAGFITGAALLAACSSGAPADSTDSGALKAEDITIAWVVGNTQDGFYQKATQGAVEAAEELGITLINQGPDAYDPAKQIPVVDSLLAQEPDALVIAPTDPEALRAPLARWSDAGIPIIVFDTALSDDPGFDLMARIGSANFAGGEMAAEAMADSIGGSGQVAIIDLNTSDKTLTARADGFKEKIASDYPDIEVVDLQYTELDFPRAQTIAQTFANKYPDLKGIFTTFSFATQYAAKGIQDLGKSADIALIGFEAGDKEIQGVEDGSIRAVVAQQPAEQGRLAIETAVKFLMGSTDAVEKNIELENVLITTDNVADMSEYYYAVD